MLKENEANLKWKPLIEKERSASVLSKLDEIAGILYKADIDSEVIGLFTGKAGVALFYFYYAKLINSEKYYNHAINLFSEVFEYVENFTDVEYCHGLTGIGWAFEHLIGNNFIEADSDDSLKELDKLAYKLMIKLVQKPKYEFLYGSTGIVHYFLNRTPSKEIDEYLSDYIFELDKLAVVSNSGEIYWKSLVDKDRRITGADFGIAHGMSGLLAILSRIYNKGIFVDKTQHLLNGGLKYFLKHKYDNIDCISNFPNYISENISANNSRMAWCYGDPGIGITLLQISYILKDSSLENVAINVLKHSAQRKELKRNGVITPGFCHGSSGLTHIYNRLYNYTNIIEFSQSAGYWLNETLKMSVEGSCFAGFENVMEDNDFNSYYSMLNGLPGIGLVLISCISDIEPKWDNALLLS